MHNTHAFQKLKPQRRESLNYELMGKQSCEPPANSAPSIKYRLVPAQIPVRLERNPVNGFPEITWSDNTCNGIVKVGTKALPARAECVCIYCRFEFTPKMTTSTEFISENYAGLDYCPKCTSQGGIIRKHDVDLSKLSMMRGALIDIVETQNRRDKLCSGSSGPINPIWDKIAELYK